MILFNGKKVAEKILQDLKKDIAKAGARPALATILVGDSPESLLYVSLKEKAAKEVGINFLKVRFPQGAGTDDVKKKIQELNQDKSVDGILVQLPLPSGCNQDEIVSEINSEKDVDGFHSKNQKLVPPLVGAILLAIKKSGDEDCGSQTEQGKKAIALVNSEIFGQRLKLFSKKEGLELEYHIKKTCPSLAEEDLKAADILITTCGCPGMIRGEMIKQGAVLVDAGITRVAEKKVRGDVDADSVRDKAGFLTPVPGGIGPMTVALLLRNVFLASQR